MKRWLILIFTFLLAACAAPASASALPENAPKASYPDLGAAPELVGKVWINTPAPIRLADLRGKVVLVDMWTFSCINCIHVIPSLRDWQEKYSSQGLVIIGNHTPEFGYERSLEALKQAVVDLKVPYAVIQDNDSANWNAYNTMYWPEIYLIDKVGHIRYVQIGEGNYAETERAIRALLNEPVE